MFTRIGASAPPALATFRESFELHHDFDRALTRAGLTSCSANEINMLRRQWARWLDDYEALPVARIAPVLRRAPLLAGPIPSAVALVLVLVVVVTLFIARVPL